MLHLTLVKALQGRAGDQIGFLERIGSVTPPSGINIRGVYFLFGRHEGTILYEASNHRTAKEIIVRMSKSAICETETLGAIPAEEL